MQSKFLAATAVAAVLAVSLALAARGEPAGGAPTAAEAQAFVAKAEADLSKLSEYQARAARVQATYITDDTGRLSAKANAEETDLSVRYAKEAARVDLVQGDPITRRKLYLLTQQLVLPASSKPGASQELAAIGARHTADMSTAKFEYKCK